MCKKGSYTSFAYIGISVAVPRQGPYRAHAGHCNIYIQTLHFTKWALEIAGVNDFWLSITTVKYFGMCLFTLSHHPSLS